jgi:hypothetical protein
MAKASKGDDRSDADSEARAQRRHRLGAALRQNLIKRKDQARARREPVGRASDTDSPEEADPERRGGCGDPARRGREPTPSRE